MPEGGFALGLGQHEDLLLGQSGGQRGVLLSQQEVVVRPGHRCKGRQEKYGFLISLVEEGKKNQLMGIHQVLNVTT